MAACRRSRSSSAAGGRSQPTISPAPRGSQTSSSPVVRHVPCAHHDARRLLRRLPPPAAERLRAVTFTVDPTRDDPQTLQRYADGFAADPTRWLFVTGDRDEVERLVRDGFRLSIAELPPGERERSPEPITHSDRFALVDAQLRIRGYYHGTDPDDVARLERDLALLTGAGA